MLAVEILISEHRLIEKMVRLLKVEAEKIGSSGVVNPSFIAVVVDFFRTYADKYHHGKEEGLLFRGLSVKNLSEQTQKLMSELMLEHAFARKNVTNLESLAQEYVKGKREVESEIIGVLKGLAELYPKHIAKEDKQFFYPSMEYFSEEEQEKLLYDFLKFDQEFTIKRYGHIVENLEAQKKSD